MVLVDIILYEVSTLILAFVLILRIPRDINRKLMPSVTYARTRKAAVAL